MTLNIASDTVLEKFEKWLAEVALYEIRGCNDLGGSRIRIQESRNSFWYEAEHILGETVMHYFEALGCGKYDKNNAKASDTELMVEAMRFLRFEHFKANP